MSKPPEELERTSTGSRVYRTPWRGTAIFACKKCQRKIKKHGGPEALRKLKSWFKQRARRATEAPALRVIDIPCVKLCPKGGVTVMTPRTLAHNPPGVSVAWSEHDLESLYCELTEVALLPEKATS